MCGVASYTAPITTSPGSTRRRPGNGSCRQPASGGPGILIGRRAERLEPEGRLPNRYLENDERRAAFTEVRDA